jgi:hypothetical protein
MITRILHITPFRALLLLLAMSAALGCGDKNTVQTPQEPQPEWVGQRPRNPSYYIGIGSASKLSQPLDYQAIAKKNALNDLATEIRVRVQGETFLNALEVNKNFSEEFISTIATTTDESIENYEIAGQWEDKNEFWVYYRLNKSEYARLKAEKKNQALSSANDFYQKGLEAETRANIPAAIDLYLRGLFALKNYWNEVNEFNLEGQKVYLDNELYASLRRVITGLTIVPGGERIVLSSENNYMSQFPVMVTYEGAPARGISLSFAYQRDRYMKPRALVTDQEGKTTAEVSHVSTTTKANWLDLVIDVEALLPPDLDKSIEVGLVKGMKPDSKRVPIELVTPSFFIESTERVYNQTGTASTLASAFQAELVKRGMRINQKPEETDYRVTITSNTTEGGTSQGFTVAFLEMSVMVVHTISGETVYKESLGSIKGLQLNKDAASIEAYKKGRERIESEIVKSLLEAIL